VPVYQAFAVLLHAPNLMLVQGSRRLDAVQRAPQKPSSNGNLHVTTCTLNRTAQPSHPHDIIDDYAMDRVDYQVARLGRLLHLSHHRKEDLRQDLLLELCQAAQRFDPATSSARTFVSRVVSSAAAFHMRTIRNERRNSARSPIRLSELQRNGHSLAARAPRWSEPSTHDLAMDLPRGLSSMDRRHQELAESLKTQTVAEIAAERGVHRSTVYRDIAAMRTTLTEHGLDPATC